MTHSVIVIALSGPIGSGKSVLAENLVQLHGAEHISTSDLMLAHAGTDLDRTQLQTFGLSEFYQGGEWIASAVADRIVELPLYSIAIVDAVRNLRQVHELRRRAPDAWRVVHVHLTADEERLEERYALRARRSDATTTWGQATQSSSEASMADLKAQADLVIDTTRLTPADASVRVSARIDSLRPTRVAPVDMLVGGQWGSEGKGNIAYILAPEYGLLVRVGAPNAGHKIYGHDNIIYTHRQLPSGTRATDAPLLIGAGAVLNVDVLLREISECSVTPERLTIDPRALIIEKDDIAQEASLKGSIGSTGTGGGAALARRIMHRGSKGLVRTAMDVDELKPYVREPTELLRGVNLGGAPIFIEGTQGTGLSILHGSFPHVTSRDTTAAALLSEVGIAPHRLRRVTVVFRTYPIRVGGPSGPMGKETSWDTIASRAGIQAEELLTNELGSVSHKQRRVAEFSWTQLQTAARINGATDIALTFADYIDIRNRSARRFEQLTEETLRFIEEIEFVANAPVSLISSRFDGTGLIDRRHW